MKSITIKSIPDEVHESIKELADMHHRSINGEVIHCLEQYTGRKKRMTTEEIIARTKELHKGMTHQCMPEEIQKFKELGRK